MDRQSFICGMITAFAECVAGESKRCALSPPFHPSEYSGLLEETKRIAGEQGILAWFDANEDVPEPVRTPWFVLYKFPEVLDEYRELRRQGLNPSTDFDQFRPLLGYGTAFGEGADVVAPRMRGEGAIMRTVARVLFGGEWPPKA